MAQQHERFVKCEAVVIVVSFEPSERVTKLRDRLRLPFIVAVDKTRVIYSAFGLGRASWLKTYGQPSVLTFYVRALTRGRAPAVRLRQDRRQLGGDFVLDKSGAVALAHPERSPNDRLPVSRMLRTLEEAAPTPKGEGL